MGVIDTLIKIAVKEEMYSLLNLLWDFDEEVKIKDETKTKLEKIIKEFNTKDKETFEKEVTDILKKYKPPSPERGSEIWRRHYQGPGKNEIGDFKPVDVRTSPEMEAAAEAHRSGTPSGLSRLFSTPSPASTSHSPPPPPIIMERVGKKEESTNNSPIRPLTRENIIEKYGSLNDSQTKIDYDAMTTYTDIDDCDCPQGCPCFRGGKSSKRRSKRGHRTKSPFRKSPKRTKKRKKRGYGGKSPKRTRKRGVRGKSHKKRRYRRKSTKKRRKTKRKKR